MNVNLKVDVETRRCNLKPAKIHKKKTCHGYVVQCSAVQCSKYNLQSLQLIRISSGLEIVLKDETRMDGWMTRFIPLWKGLSINTTASSSNDAYAHLTHFLILDPSSFFFIFFSFPFLFRYLRILVLHRRDTAINAMRCQLMDQLNNFDRLP